jgi:Zn-dependent protease with chaperone function
MASSPNAEGGTGPVALKGLEGRHFQHPDDAAMVGRISAVPGIEGLIKAIMEYGYERLQYASDTASAIRVTPRQCVAIHALASDACRILDVPMPELYIIQSPVANAYTYGQTRPFIVLHSALIDLLDRDELLAVIGLELGHIKCGHVLYQTMASFIALITSSDMDFAFGFGALVSAGPRSILLEWSCKAELSCDRAGLLTVQDPRVSVGILMKLAGGTQRLYEQMDREEFLRQGEDYEQLYQNMLDKFDKVMISAGIDHPFPAVRARHPRLGSIGGLSGVNLSAAPEGQRRALHRRWAIGDPRDRSRSGIPSRHEDP